QSFDPAVMIELNKQAPQVTNAFLVENMEGFEANMAKLDFTPDIYSPYYKFIDTILVTTVHAKNMKLIPWTVNDTEEMKKLIDLGVDGIITDYPDRIALINEEN
ncbi:MAG: glycerophosphoryl diester phosphodiesterase, partial [Saprospiraceae bacterium]